MGIIDPMQRSGAQGYKDGRSREITTVRSQPVTQGVISGDLNQIPEVVKETVNEEEFPVWAGNKKRFSR